MSNTIGQLRIYTAKLEKELDLRDVNYGDAKAQIAELKKENEQQKIEMLSLHSHSKCPCKDEFINIRAIMRSMYRYPHCYHNGRGPKVVEVLDICDRLIYIQNNTVTDGQHTCSHKNFVTTKLGRSCIECNHNALHGIREETGEEFLRRAESYSILEVK